MSNLDSSFSIEDELFMYNNNEVERFHEDMIERREFLQENPDMLRNLVSMLLQNSNEFRFMVKDVEKQKELVSKELGQIKDEQLHDLLRHIEDLDFFVKMEKFPNFITKLESHQLLAECDEQEFKDISEGEIDLDSFKYRSTFPIVSNGLGINNTEEINSIIKKGKENKDQLMLIPLNESLLQFFQVKFSFNIELEKINEGEDLTFRIGFYPKDKVSEMKFKDFHKNSEVFGTDSMGGFIAIGFNRLSKRAMIGTKFSLNLKLTEEEMKNVCLFFKFNCDPNFVNIEVTRNYEQKVNVPKSDETFPFYKLFRKLNFTHAWMYLLDHLLDNKTVLGIEDNVKTGEFFKKCLLKAIEMKKNEKRGEKEEEEKDLMDLAEPLTYVSLKRLSENKNFWEENREKILEKVPLLVREKIEDENKIVKISGLRENIEQYAKKSAVPEEILAPLRSSLYQTMHRTGNLKLISKDEREFFVHKEMVTLKSNFFYLQFKSRWSETEKKDDSLETLRVNFLKGDELKLFIQFLYLDEIVTNDIVQICNLYKFASQFFEYGLKFHCYVIIKSFFCSNSQKEDKRKMIKNYMFFAKMALTDYDFKSLIADLKLKVGKKAVSISWIEEIIAKNEQFSSFNEKIAELETEVKTLKKEKKEMNSRLEEMEKKLNELLQNK